MCNGSRGVVRIAYERIVSFQKTSPYKSEQSMNTLSVARDLLLPLPKSLLALAVCFKSVSVDFSQSSADELAPILLFLL